jgi:acyl carrier protein
VTDAPAWDDPAAFLGELATTTELGRRAAPLALEAHLRDDLHLDSLGYVELAVVLAGHGVVLSDDDWLDVHTLGDLWFHYGFRRSNPVPPP